LFTCHDNKLDISSVIGTFRKLAPETTWFTQPNWVTGKFWIQPMQRQIRYVM